MSVIRLYTTDTCPKCRALKVYLKELGTDFEVRDMVKSMPYLQANDAWPRDTAAPVLEVGKPGKTEFYDHWTLFDRNGLKKDLVALIISRIDSKCL